jgi:hypothetical protein
MQADIYMKMYKCSDFKYCSFGSINTAYRVFMRVYNGLLPTANLAFHLNITKKLAFAIYKANIFYRIFEQTTVVDKTSVSISPAVSRQSFETFYRCILH